MVTSFDWTAFGGVGLANRSRTAWLFRFKGGGVHVPSAQSTALACNSNGRAGASEAFPTEIVLENPGALCLQMDTQAYGEAIIGVVNGFLAPDK